jgi:Na+/melibiose symporter-like transporter
VAGVIALILITFFYKLDDDVMNTIKTELEARRAKLA